MATDKFVPGDLVLVDFPGSGYWPCQVSRIMSKNWRKVEYFGGGEEIGKAHVQVIRDYDEATKDDLEEFIPKIKMDEDPILRQAVKQINQKFTGKKMKMRGVKKGTRNETKKMSDKKETGGKQKLEKTSEKKEGTGDTNETRKTRGEKEFIGTNKETKKNIGKGELEKKKIAKKAFIGTRNKTKKITGIAKIISTTKENDRKKENSMSLRAGESDMRGSGGLINADSSESDQSRPNNEVPLDNNTTGTSQNINSHLLLNGGVNSSNKNIKTSPQVSVAAVVITMSKQVPLTIPTAIFVEPLFPLPFLKALRSITTTGSLMMLISLSSVKSMKTPWSPTAQLPQRMVVHFLPRTSQLKKLQPLAARLPRKMVVHSLQRKTQLKKLQALATLLPRRMVVHSLPRISQLKKL